jgi:hypothetical protein
MIEEEYHDHRLIWICMIEEMIIEDIVHDLAKDVMAIFLLIIASLTILILEMIDSIRDEMTLVR